MSPEDPILKQAGLNIARKLAEKYRSIDALSRVPMGDCQQGLGLLTELFEHIDTQAAQIESLKEKLIQERGKYIAVYEEDEWDFDDLPELDAREYIRTAHQQLKADPDLQKAGVEWE